MLCQRIEATIDTIGTAILTVFERLIREQGSGVVTFRVDGWMLIRVPPSEASRNRPIVPTLLLSFLPQIVCGAVQARLPLKRRSCEAFAFASMHVSTRKFVKASKISSTFALVAVRKHDAGIHVANS
ncbi:tryptophan synthase [Pseudozyma hubeiensis SY62]|uniref:Tryptophan synthase n=1 Tax=Pseudozyma hubeiensis (strain SY62) TaxID=1305764 RepID=R9PDD9_PSEHS|nr:tryptophan synthase [Pseudozyma hubeiensis SY62]GAC99388.1 tryptophan synthase [Pseudozyma hubeiensis SY62]